MTSTDRHFSTANLFLNTVFIYGWATILSAAFLIVKNTIIPGQFSPVPSYPANIYLYSVSNLLTDFMAIFLLFYWSKKFFNPVATSVLKVKIIACTALFGCLFALIAVPHYQVSPETNQTLAFWHRNYNEKISTSSTWKMVGECQKLYRNQISEQ